LLLVVFCYSVTVAESRSVPQAHSCPPELVNLPAVTKKMAYLKVFGQVRPSPYNCSS
jgi:hypothetical protein